MNNTENPPQKSIINPGTVDGLVDVSDVHLNVSQKLIIITEDKVRIHLSNHLTTVEKRKGWIAPLGILLTIIVCLVTSNFKTENILFDAPTWKAIFIISGVLSAGWLAYSIIQAWRSESMDELIERLKKESK